MGRIVRQTHANECRRCTTFCDRVIAPSACVARDCPFLYSYDDPAGVWVWVVGVGWKRLSPASLSGHGHMAILASLATHDNITVDYHEDAAGRIDQILV